MASSSTPALPQPEISTTCEIMHVYESCLQNKMDMQSARATQRSSTRRYLRSLRHPRIHTANPTDINTSGQRDNLLQDSQETVPQLAADAFFKDGGLLPPLPQLPEGVDMNEVLRRLQGGASQPLDTNNRWKGFSEPADFTLGTREDLVFSRLPRIIDRIVTASGIDPSKRTLIFECNPSGVPSSTTRGDSSKPDCVGRFAIAAGDYSKRKWLEVAVPGEFKRLENSTNERDDFAKVLWSLNHIMRDDPRRRFTYGFTIEGWTTLRIWYANRSDLFVSWALNVHEQHERLVQFFLRLTFADPYQLGWDPTMRLAPSVDPRAPVCYDIDLNGKTYRTRRMLSSVGAEALTGRGTRVWEVKEFLENEDDSEKTPTLVLKDSWVDDGRMREGKILQKITESAAKNGGIFSVLVDKLFMKALTWGDVIHQGKQDDTFTSINRAELLKEVSGKVKVKVNPTARKKFVDHKPVTGVLTAPEEEPESQLQYGPKVHHRIIFTEVGKRLTELTSLSEVFNRLCDIVMGLRALHKGGRVHRDISIGNILVVDGVGKITDVEYAKSERAPTQPGVRTGTRFFMSPEVECCKYLYRKRVQSEEPPPSEFEASEASGTDEDEYMRSLLAAHQRPKKQRRPGTGGASGPEEKVPAKKSKPQFRNNPLHDLESVFWVALWVLLCSEYLRKNTKLTQEEWDARIVQHGYIAAKLFCKPSFRRDVMTLGDGDFDFEQPLAKFLPQVQKVGISLKNFRKLLITSYEKAEAELVSDADVVPFTVAENLYTKILRLFKDISATLEKTEDLTIVVKGEDNIPIKMVNEAMNPEVSAEPAYVPGASSSRVRSDRPDDDDTSMERPAKSRKTQANKTATAPPAVAPFARRTRSQTKSLPGRGGGGASGSMRG